MKKVLLLFLAIMLLSGCAMSTPEDIEINEWEMGGVSQNGRSARIDDVVLYDCGRGERSTYLKKNDTPIRLDEIVDFDIWKISSSDSYFYLSGGRSEVWGGKTNVLVVDMNGEIVAKKKCCCEWIYVSGNTILGYYNGEDDLFDSADGWAATRMEVTHSINEEEFLKTEDDDISKWEPFTGAQVTVNDKTLFRRKDSEHEVSYYTDTVYYDDYGTLEYISYVDGIMASESGWLPTRKYKKQLRKMMGSKEKNFDVYSWQFGDKLFGICNVYSKSGGYLQHFSQDIKYGMLFRYDPDKDSISLEEKYDGKELAYCDEDWMIYRKESEIFIENLNSHEAKKIFESDTVVDVDLSGDVVTMWDEKDGEINHSDAAIFR